MRRQAFIPFILISVLPVFLILATGAPGGAGPHPIEQYRGKFENALTTIADQYIGTPYGFVEKDGGHQMDNSRLFYQIYRQAAETAGMRFLGYAPMKRLLKRTMPVDRDHIRVGDLIVLNNGLAALIYKMENDHLFYMVYVSEKRGSVISFNSENVVYDAYWMNYLKGFYRLTPYNFLPKN